jgi:glycosyltransferase involved in cell wall biosynthesis
VTYNRRDCLPRAIDSILLQDPVPHEIIIVDDGSTDGTIELIRSRFGDRVRLIEQPHGGVSAARRRGVAEATGEWIGFLDSDDEWIPGRQAVMEQIATSAPEDIQWIFGDSLLIYPDHKETLFTEKGWHQKAEIEVLDRPMTAIHPDQLNFLPSSLVRKSALMRAGNFGENLSTAEDTLIAFRIALMGRFVCLRQVVTAVDRTGRSDSLVRSSYSTPDYHRALMLSFDAAAGGLGRGRWRQMYASAVRAWCITRARRGERCRAQAFLQFKHAAGPRELLFALCAMLGPRFVRYWGKLRGLRPEQSPSPAPADSCHASLAPGT